MPEKHPLENFIRFMFALLLVLVVATLLVRLVILANVSRSLGDPSISEAELALIRAQDALASAELILSFIEGASVLVAIGLGAAAIYGYRSARELRQDLEVEVTNLRDLREKIQPYTKDLEGLEEKLKRYEEKATATSQKLLPNFNNVLRSTIELNLKNYSVAHYYANRVLEDKPPGDTSEDNTQALYIAGWLELQYIEGKLDEGVAKLKMAYDLDPHSPSIQAAYGVGLRRQARELPLESRERRSMMMEALTHLHAAIRNNEGLLDLNRESFWGPIGGTERDLGNKKEALEAYKRANKITPNSSYPLGNMAELYLALLHEEKGNLKEGMNCFQKTIKLAIRELGASFDDYYPNMDLAMSHTMLGEWDSEVDHFGESEQYFARALEMDGITSRMLDVSLGGWVRLQGVCPDDWNAVEKRISSSISRLKDRITEIKQKEKA